MNIDSKTVYDYVPEVQKILQEKYGVRFLKGDLRKIMIAPFKNIVYCLYNGDEVNTMYVKFKLILKRKRRE